MTESVPPASTGPRPRRPLWRRVLGLPRHLWNAADELVDSLWPRMEGGRRKLAVFLAFLVGLLVSPIALLMSRRARRAPDTRLHDHVKKLWTEQSPYESIAFLRKAHEHIEAVNRSRGLKTIFGPIEIEPLGRFEWSDQLEIASMLHYCLMTMEMYDDALAFAESQPVTTSSVLDRVDCLLKLYRKGDAIRLLEANLQLDGRRRVLGKRLDSLRGPRLRSVD